MAIDRDSKPDNIRKGQRAWSRDWQAWQCCKKTEEKETYMSTALFSFVFFWDIL